MLLTRVIGSGKEAIVCLHGWSSIFDSAPEFLEKLGRHFQLVLVYLPGYSGQPDDLQTESVDWLLSEIAATLESRGFTRFHLLGHSMGAQFAVQFAERYPDRIDKLILVGARTPEKRNELSAWWSNLPGITRLVRSILPLEYRVVNRAFAYAQQLTPGREIKTFQPINVSVHGAFDTLIANIRQYSDPFQTKQPTLYIYGENDRMRPDYWPKNKMLYLVKEAGHWVFTAQPGLLAEKIQQFLN